MPNMSFIDPNSPDYAAIMRQRQMAQALGQQALEPLQTNQTAGGFVVPVSPLQGLAKIAQAGMSGYMQNQADARQKALAEQLRKRGSEDMQSVLEAMQGKPEQVKPFEADNPFNEDLSQFGNKTVTPAVAPNPQEAMARALASENPMVQGVGAKLLENQMKAPEWALGERFNEKTGMSEKFMYNKNNPSQMMPVGGQQAAKMEMGPAGQVYNPYSVQPGQVFNDPNKPFALGPNGPVANIPYQNFEMNKSAAGASKQTTLVNAYTPASEAAQKDFIDSSRKNWETLQSAPATIQNIDAAKKLIPQAKGFMGPGGESLLGATKFLNDRMGMNINTEGVNNAEELRTRLFMQIMDNLKKMDAQPSQMQQIMMRDSLGHLGTDPNALPRVLDVMKQAVEQKVGQHNKTMADAEKRGVKFPFNPIIDLPSQPQNTSGGAKFLGFE